MKKIFASMMMLAATSTGFAQQVTAPEPEFIACSQVILLLMRSQKRTE